MAMRIQHNLNSLNTYNRLSAATQRLSKASKKLSSGYRINRSADDAAGLAVSEKMRSQIRGLSQAVRNAQDGINYIQTGEGALEEIHSILQRYKELAAESANGSYDNPTDRAALQLEWQQLCSETDQISETDFNGHQIFDIGSNESKSSLIALRTTDGAFIPVMITHETLQETVEKAIKDAPDKNFTEAALKNFSNAIKNNYLPQVLDRIVKTLPKSSVATVSGMQISYNLENEKSNTLASVGSTGTMFTLNINTEHLNMNGSGQIEMTDSLASTITHEMVHAIMFDTLSNGMLGLDPIDGVQGKTEEAYFPDWFCEGMAEAVSGGLNRFANLGSVDGSDGKNLCILPIYNNSSYTDDQIINSIPPNYVKNVDHWEPSDELYKLFAGKIKDTMNNYAPYEQGYAAVMYLGHLAINNGKSDAPVNGSKIAEGLDRILCEVASGKSLNRVIKEQTGKNTKEFVDNFAAGGNDVVNFLKDFIKACNGKASIVDRPDNKIGRELAAGSGAGALGTPAKLTGAWNTLLAGGANHYFTLVFGEQTDPPDPYPFFSPNSNKYEGGSGITDGTDRNGNKPSNVIPGGGVNGGVNDPDKPDDPNDPDKPDDPDNPDSPNKPNNPAYGNRGITPGSITLQVGSRSKDIVKFSFAYDCDAVGDLKCDFNCSAKGLGISGLSISKQEDANKALDRVDYAINKVSMMRTVFGAAQNRLEHKITNLTITNENLTESESSIRDTDMASEMLNFTKYNIIQQAAQSMLVQANQLPQSVLQLLQ